MCVIEYRCILDCINLKRIANCLPQHVWDKSGITYLQQTLFLPTRQWPESHPWSSAPSLTAGSAVPSHNHHLTHWCEATNVTQSHSNALVLLHRGDAKTQRPPEILQYRVKHTISHGNLVSQTMATLRFKIQHVNLRDKS